MYVLQSVFFLIPVGNAGFAPEYMLGEYAGAAAA